MLFVRIITLLFTVCFTPALLAQVTYRGKVTDKQTGQPLQGASVFFSNTSYGTTSAADGTFALTVPQVAKFDLVVAMVGYETGVMNLGSVESGTLLTVTLKPEVKELEAVVLQAYEKDGWNKWGRFFLENFVGTSEYAADCSIKNYKDIRFRHNKTDKELIVVCRKPLIIENKALGYVLRYQLEQFTYNFKTHYLIFTGYPLFEEMQGSERKIRKWKERREEVFSGSVMHFMRSVFTNRIKENHFLVYRMRVVPNLEKKRVGEVYRKAGPANFNNFPADSVTYYNTVMRQANAFNYLYKTELTGDSIAYGIDSATVGMTFEDHLVVVYTQKKEPAMYRQQTNAKGAEGASASSSITLMNSNEPLEISSNGAFVNPVNMITSEYWAWAEKIAFMLPLDYKVRR